MSGLEIKVLIQIGLYVKKNFPQVLAAVLLALVFPFMLLIMTVTSVFSFLGWDTEQPMNVEPYKKIARESNLVWQELLAVDLALHNLDQEKLEPKKMEDEFVYFIEVHYSTLDAYGVRNNYTVLEKHTRTFAEVMMRLHFTAEQQDIARNSLAMLLEQSGGVGGGIITENVLRYESLIRYYAAVNGVESYISVMMAMIQQESGGNSLDVMQASESLGLPPNTITDPAYSIQVGVKYFASTLAKAQNDVKLALQAYNFGLGFIDYALPRGGYSRQNAVEYSVMMAERMGWSRYGDINYVDNVMRYVSMAVDGQRFDPNAVHEIMRKYIGYPYLFGGREPKDGGFDCSGFIGYTFAQIGINISGTAADQYARTSPVSETDAQPGDLVFFSTYKEGPSHVGMYVGNGQFINANDSGVGYSSVSRWKELYPFLGFRRIQ